MKFKVGDKVICVNNRKWKDLLNLHQVYTVSGCCSEHNHWVTLKELKANNAYLDLFPSYLFEKLPPGIPIESITLKNGMVLKLGDQFKLNPDSVDNVSNHEPNSKVWNYRFKITRFSEDILGKNVIYALIDGINEEIRHPEDFFQIDKYNNDAPMVVLI